MGISKRKAVLGIIPEEINVEITYAAIPVVIPAIIWGLIPEFLIIR